MAEDIEVTIGVDLGDRFSHYCVLEQESGEQLDEGRLPMRPEAIEHWFVRQRRARVVLEVGTHSPWVSRLAKAPGHEVLVAYMLIPIGGLEGGFTSSALAWVRNEMKGLVRRLLFALAITLILGSILWSIGGARPIALPFFGVRAILIALVVVFFVPGLGPSEAARDN